MEEIKFSTCFADITVQANGIVYVYCFKERYESVALARAHMDEIRKQIGTLDIYSLSDISNIKFASKPVRDYIASEEVLQPKANAVLTNSSITKILGNIFLRFSKPTYPTRLFSNKEQAEKWLLDQMPK